MKVYEIFHSIQGEGVTIGTPTTFVRFAGCNLECDWCDTKYAREGGKEMSADEIISAIREIGCCQICITGGEPMHQSGVIPLIEELLESGFLVTLETNGSISLEELPFGNWFIISMDFKCPSSGMHEKMLVENIDLLSPNDQLKLVIADRADYEFAKKVLVDNGPICNVVMTPVDGRDLEELAGWVLEDKLNIRVLPQLHKLIWGDKRGV